MSKEDIDKAVKDAEQYAAEDKKRREEVDAKNEAENMAYQADKLVNENGDKLAADDKSNLSSKAQAVKDAIAKNDIAMINAAKDELQKALYEVSAKLYQQAAPQQGNPGQPGPDMGGAAPDMGAQPGSQNDDGSFNADGSVQ